MGERGQKRRRRLVEALQVVDQDDQRMGAAQRQEEPAQRGLNAHARLARGLWHGAERGGVEPEALAQLGREMTERG